MLVDSFYFSLSLFQINNAVIYFYQLEIMMDFDLQEVFSILDENNEGQIQLRRFVDVANNYYSDAEVSFFYLNFLFHLKQLFKRNMKR